MKPPVDGRPTWDPEMLSKRHLQLLTAYVDGELSQRHRETVERLVKHSPEARTLLKKYRADAAGIHGLPQKSLDADFTNRVVERIARHRPITIVLPSQEPYRKGVPIWVGFATAAAVLFAVSVGSYFYFNEPLATPDHRPQSIAKEVRPRRPDKNELAANKEAADSQLVKGDKSSTKTLDNDRANMGPPDPQSGRPKESGPETSDNETRLASPVPEMEMFQAKAPDVSLGAILSLHQLDHDKLMKQMKPGQTIRLELPCRETAKAFARVEAAYKANGTILLIDQNAQLRLRLPKLKTNYVFYLEDLTPVELVKVLEQLGSEDKRVEDKQKNEGLFDKLIVDPMVETHHKQLAQLLGVDLRGKPKPPVSVDPKKPLSESTGNQVAQNLAGQGGAPRPDPNKPAAKPGEHLALALAYNPVRPHASSPEVKRFIDSRKTPRPGTIQVLLVLRGI
ncbi:MAG: anti-sigma factor family protein [Gemmataceae bacterium]